MNKAKYNKIKEAFEALTLKKADVDLLASLKTVLDEATNEQGLIKIIVERNKQELLIPASLLTDYVTQRKTDIETEVDTLVDKVTING
jgi:hypothetical protein